jgi:MbtH protein
MNNDANEGYEHFLVTVNAEGAYSIWPDDTAMPLPAGWSEPPVPFRGTKALCLQHIRTAWTDMRPKSLQSSSPNIAVARSSTDGSNPT